MFVKRLAFLLGESHDEYPIVCDRSDDSFGIVIRDEDELLDLVRCRFGRGWEQSFMKDFDEHGFIATPVPSSGLIKYVHPSVKRADDLGSLLTPTATKRKAAGTTDAAPKRVKASPL